MSLEFSQQDFTGGMNLLFDATKIADNEYPLLVNGRHRNNYIRPIKEPSLLTDLPEGNYQGLYAAGVFLVAFVSGLAYYKNFQAATTWIPVAGLQLDPDVDRIYAQLVDASTVNFKRELTAEAANSNVNLTSTANSSPKCAVVQDGLNQPWVILPDGTARITQSYAEWDDANREYVPIGTLMAYVSGVLYVVGINGEIFRSVTGRPLDFVINIDTTGAKGGVASTTSFRVNFNEITCLQSVAVNAQAQGSFFISTLYSSHLVIPNFDNLIFGEPTFRVVDLFPTGALNQVALADVIGDTVFVDQKGLRSFNSVQQTSFEGQNTPFSANVAALFGDITQSVASVGKFSNYVLFAVNTIYGYAVIVYDEITQKFVGIDQFNNVGAIKQFAEVKTPTERRLFFITQDNQLYEAFAGRTATAKLFVGEWTASRLSDRQAPRSVNINFTDAEEAGEVQATLFRDRVRDYALIEPISQSVEPIVPPIALPFGQYNDLTIDTKSFLFQQAKLAWKVGVLVSWNCLANLLALEISSEKDTNKLPFSERAKAYTDYTTIPTEDDLVFAVTGSDGVDTQDKAAVVALVEGFQPSLIVNTGDLDYIDPVTGLNNWAQNVTKYWGKWIDSRAFYAALGNYDLDTNNGAPFLGNLRPPNNGRYYDIVRGDVHFFFINSGYNTAGILKEPDGNTETSLQALWLKSRLSSSKAQWKIVVGHKPLWTSDVLYYQGYTTLRWPLKRWGASLVINGDGDYERLNIEGFNYLNVALGGATKLGFASNSIVAGSKVRYNAKFGALKGRANKFELELKFFSVDNELVDSLYLRA